MFVLTPGDVSAYSSQSEEFSCGSEPIVAHEEGFVLIRVESVPSEAPEVQKGAPVQVRSSSRLRQAGAEDPG